MAKKYLIPLILFLALIIPNKSFGVYYSAVGFLFFFSTLRSFKFHKLQIILLLATAILVVSRSIFWHNIAEFKELVKISFMILTIAFLRSNEKFIKSITTCNLISAFVLLNFFISVNLVLNLIAPLNAWILEYYTAESQKILYTFNSIRSTGLSSGVGQQGLTSLISMVYFFETPLKSKSRKIFFLIALITLVLSQSKTAFGLGLVYLLFIFQSHRGYLIVSLIALIAFIIRYLEELKIVFRELFQLFSGGNFSSMNSRVSNWNEFILPMIEFPISFIFGIGRSYFEAMNQKSSVYDSDFIYTLVNFGILGLAVLMIFLIKSMQPLKTRHRFVLILIICSGFTLNPIFEPKLFVLLTILIITLTNYDDTQNNLDSN